MSVPALGGGGGADSPGDPNSAVGPPGGNAIDVRMKLRLGLFLAIVAPVLVACSGAEKPVVDPAGAPPPPPVEQPSSAPSAAAAPVPEASAPAPTACTAAPPITLQPSVPNASSPISAVLVGTTLWVFHMGAGTGASLGVPVLLEVTDAASDARKITEHKLPAGNVGTSSALATYKGGVIGTFVGDAGVTLFHKPARGDLQVKAFPGPGITSMGSIARVGDRALATYGEDNNGVHFGWFDLATMRLDGALSKLGGEIQQPAVSGAFGGILFFSDTSKQDAPVELRARLASGGAAFALPALGGDNGAAAVATSSGDRAYLVYNTLGGMAPGAMFPSGKAKLATITDDKGNGTTVTLGQTGMVPEMAVQGTSWGVMAVFSGARGEATAAFAGASGALIGSPIRVSGDGERVRQPAIAAGDRSGFVVWNQMGSTALRMATVSCK